MILKAASLSKVRLVATNSDLTGPWITIIPPALVAPIRLVWENRRTLAEANPLMMPPV
ncbi:MAG: hypothetical protein ACLR2G_09310 [Phascolarctobacterium faecium]